MPKCTANLPGQSCSQRCPNDSPSEIITTLRLDELLNISLDIREGLDAVLLSQPSSWLCTNWPEASWPAGWLKVSFFQNEFMKSSFLAKYEQKIVRISALCS
jgi:hypothetical protein